jgi:hypothetical protein
MCIICIEYEKGKLSLREAFRNLNEIKELIGEEHFNDVESVLSEKEILFENDFDLYDDKEYWEEFGFGD